MKSNTTETGAGETASADLSKQLAESQAELAEARQHIKNFGIVPKEIEGLVAQRMRMGLSREDAVACARRQVAHDKVLKEASTIKVEHSDPHEAAKLTRRKQADFIGDKLIRAGSL